MARQDFCIARAPRLLPLTYFALLVVPLFAISGCGSPPPAGPLPELHPVKGKLKYEGGPLTGMTITFDPAKGTAGRVCSGEIKADGSFELYTVSPGDGAADGDYKLYFMHPKSGKRSGPTIPPKYLSAEDTDITATIKPDTLDLGTITIKK